MYIPQIPIFLLGFLLSIAATSCSTLEKALMPFGSLFSSGEKDKYSTVVDMKSWHIDHGPWPSKSDIWAKSLDDADLIAMSKEYEAWDFNSDGRPDLVHRFNDRGHLVETAFDFDLDGDVDVIRSYAEE